MESFYPFKKYYFLNFLSRHIDIILQLFFYMILISGFWLWLRTLRQKVLSRFSINKRPKGNVISTYPKIDAMNGKSFVNKINKKPKTNVDYENPKIDGYSFKPEINGDCENPKINRDCEKPMINGDCHKPKINGECDNLKINVDCEKQQINGECDKPKLNGHCAQLNGSLVNGHRCLER